jgi:hypothetical protein
MSFSPPTIVPSSFSGNRSGSGARGEGGAAGNMTGVGGVVIGGRREGRKTGRSRVAVSEPSGISQRGLPLGCIEFASVLTSSPVACTPSSAAPAHIIANHKKLKHRHMSPYTPMPPRAHAVTRRPKSEHSSRPIRAIDRPRWGVVAGIGSMSGRALHLERAAGIEPATYSLGSCRSTTELRPRGGLHRGTLRVPRGGYLAFQRANKNPGAGFARTRVL